jgi:membrane protein implicated in regulation of membrane protease activity
MNNFTNSLPEIIWFVIGLLLILLEFTMPGIILVFFGIGAWIVTILVYADILQSVTSQLFVFAAASLILLLVLRRWVKDKFYGHISGSQDLSQNLDEFTGMKVHVLSDVVPGKTEGIVEFKGANWSAVSDEEIKSGETGVIMKNDGLTLIIKKEGGQADG